MHEITAIAALAIVAIGCTVESKDDNPFATGTPPMTSATPTSGSGSAGSEGSGSSSGGGESSSEGADGSTSSPVTTGPMSTTTSVSVGESSSDGGGSGVQPDMGMYSHCEDSADCGFSPILCMTITDAMGVQLNGFCSETGCANAAVDCDPSPAPTVSPVCITVGADSICALQCTGGAACPVGMTCYNLTGIGEVCG